MTFFIDCECIFRLLQYVPEDRLTAAAALDEPYMSSVPPYKVKGVHHTRAHWMPDEFAFEQKKSNFEELRYELLREGKHHRLSNSVTLISCKG